MRLKFKFKKHVSLYLRWAAVVVGLFFVWQLFSTVWAVVEGGSMADLAWLMAGDLQKDTDDRTNILLLGVGGDNHPGGDLTDSMMVASYSHTYGTLTLFSVPRDLWLEKASGLPAGRINRVYDDELKLLKNDKDAALMATAGVVGNVLNIQIPYYAMIAFKGFTDVVDAVGGVDVNVPEAVVDPLYPCADMVHYCPLSITVGLHHMDGALALKYSRSRETTTDFARSVRQQQVLEALRAQALNSGVLTSPKKLRALYTALSENITTNLKFREILRLGQIAQGFDHSKIAHAGLTDDLTKMGGFLGAGERAKYGGAAVEVPLDPTFARIRLFAGIVFGHPQIVTQKNTVEVLNASSKGPVAMDAAYMMTRFGFNAVKVENYPNKAKLPESAVYVYDAMKAGETASVLAQMLGVPLYRGPAELQGRGYDISLVLGENWQGVRGVK